MKKLLALMVALLVIGATGILVVAQENPSVQPISAQARARIKTMGTLGTGIAISTSDPMDFELLKVGIARVAVVSDTDTGEESVVKAGVLYFGEDKYRLRNVVIGNGSASADIYDSEGTQAGTISLDSYPKGDREVWAGDLSLNDATYNAYVIQVPRVLKAVEKARRIFSYCEENPGECLRVMRGIGNIICDPESEGTSCRDKIRIFCENNPEDNRCNALRLAYCKQNLDDADCRAEIMERCKENADEETCERLGQVYENVVQRRPQIASIVKNAPQWLKTVTAKIKNRPANTQAGGE